MFPSVSKPALLTSSKGVGVCLCGSFCQSACFTDFVKGVRVHVCLCGSFCQSACFTDFVKGVRVCLCVPSVSQSVLLTMTCVYYVWSVL